MMSNIETIKNLGNLDITLRIIETSMIVLFAYYIFTKIANIKEIRAKSILISLISSPIISFIVIKLKDEIDLFHSTLMLIILSTLINLINYKKDKINTLITTIISLVINYIIYSTSLFIAFFPTVVFKIVNDYISLLIIFLIYLILTYKIFKIQKIKYGIVFLQKKISDQYLNMLIINICVNILFLVILLQDGNILAKRKVSLSFFIFAITMILTMVQSFKLYYKQTQLVKDLEQTKEELNNKNIEIKKLEKENLEFSKTSHSLHHKQKALEYKIEKIMKDISEEDNKKLKTELNEIAKEMYKEPLDIELPKTDVPKIDDMIEYMRAECIKNNIKFELQITGNIHYMVNHLITENELEILLADHIKDSIIAINSSNNSNRSILVRLGKIDDIYCIYIYDSGIEFSKDVLDKLGKEPVTTHKENGGTGLGFMNTFDVLKRYKISLTIDELGKPTEDNYTKILKFEFNNKEQFLVKSLHK